MISYHLVSVTRLLTVCCLLFLAACAGGGAPFEEAADEEVLPVVVEPGAEEGVLRDTAVPTPTEKPMKADLPDLGVAPEFKNDTWLNTVEPITLASLQGKVVLVEFWTFGCINCQRTTPWIKEWHARYAGDDFAVVTIHYPEFSYERDIDNVANALAENGITYPVAIDNDRLTWNAYGQRYWPTTYLIDKSGHIRYVHIGEFTRGSDQEAAAAIEALIAEPGPES